MRLTIPFSQVAAEPAYPSGRTPVLAFLAASATADKSEPTTVRDLIVKDSVQALHRRIAGA